MTLDEATILAKKVFQQASLPTPTVHIEETPHIYAGAYVDSCRIFVSRALLELPSADISSVLAHEAGHVYYKHVLTPNYFYLTEVRLPLEIQADSFAMNIVGAEGVINLLTKLLHLGDPTLPIRIAHLKKAHRNYTI